MQRKVLVVSVLLPRHPVYLPVSDLHSYSAHTFFPREKPVFSLMSCSLCEVDLLIKMLLFDLHIASISLPPVFNLNFSDWGWRLFYFWECIEGIYSVSDLPLPLPPQSNTWAGSKKVGSSVEAMGGDLSCRPCYVHESVSSGSTVLFVELRIPVF